MINSMAEALERFKAEHPQNFETHDDEVAALLPWLVRQVAEGHLSPEAFSQGFQGEAGRSDALAKAFGRFLARMQADIIEDGVPKDEVAAWMRRKLFRLE